MKGENGTDWSRKSRSYLKTLSVSNKMHKITEYFPILNQIDKLIFENKRLSKFIQSELAKHTNEISTNSQKFTSKFLNKLFENSIKNADRNPRGRHHNEVITKFAISLFIWSGPMAYEFLHKNLPEAIPSTSLIRDKIHSQYSHISEGEFMFDELVTHLQRFKCPMVVSLSEDATRIISRVEYDPQTNQCVGFVLPANNEGFFQHELFKATSFQSIKQMFETGIKSKFAYVYVVQPLCDGVPSFCLTCLGTNNKFDYHVILMRWKHIVSELTKRNIKVVNFSSDGDSRLLKAMLIMLSLQKEPSFNPCTILPSQNELPSEWTEWFKLYT